MLLLGFKSKLLKILILFLFCMDTQEIVVKAEMEDMGSISKVIQDHKGDFLSIDQEGNFLIVISRIFSKDFENVRNGLKSLLGDNFKLDLYKKK